MATIAPDTTESAASAGSSRSSRAGRPGTGAPIEDPRAGDRPAARDDHAAPRRTTSRGPPPPRRPPSRPGPRPATRSGPGSCAGRRDLRGEPRRSSGPGRMRETGASHSKMHHESNFAYGEILAAATLPWQPYGSLVPTVVKGRLSMVRRVPVGVVGAITPWNSPSVLGMRVVAPALALGNAVVLKPDPQTPVIGGAMFEAVFREAGLPEGLLQVVVGGADVGEALVTDPNVTGRLVHRLDGRRPAGRRARRGAPEEGLARARRQQRVHRPRRRGPRGRGRGRRLLLVPVPGPGLLRGRAPHRPRERRRRLHRARCREGEAPADRRPVPRGRPARPDRQREAGRAASTDIVRPLGRRRVRASSIGGDARGPVLPPDGPRRRHAGPARVDRRDLRPGRAGHDVQHRRGGARARQQQRVRPRRRGLLAVDLARPGRRQPDQGRHGPRQRRHAQRRGDDPVRRDGRCPATAAATAARPTSTTSPSGSG